MFNGSVTRIAYAIKDPLNYAQSTKAVLAETAKKFQDALDDCEIQILEAKWYLEHQLALNKARREAEAREESAAHAKRKHEEIKDEPEKAAPENERENAPKRVKTAEPEEPVALKQQPSQSPSQRPPPLPAATAVPNGTNNAASKTGEKPKASVTTEVKKAKPPTATAPAPPPRQQDKPSQSVQIPEKAMPQPTAEEMPKITPQDTPGAGNEDFNFVSMFGEPSGDNLDGAGNDMNFDLNLGNGFDAESAAQHLNVHDSSLNSLLPGLESYANQAGDDNSFNMGDSTNTQTANGGGGTDIGGGGMTTDNNAQQQINITDFSLPALGPNEFDDLLNSNDMTFDDSLNLNDDGMMSMENMENMDMDFDSMFK
ncbi:hypothetical protein A1O1_09041 [Capronia coronata CBS 617.96]|uniref:Uncharacterized protein n=1 Tax=Capronia coronata CBS 617.96 TaxID=1182541 RepID=W9XMT2_9EURO|nr:uncharacterized protein A1O1_09041 [Capronia coronata CBS 617.96]EXJ78640.1 hypothetical protein A1O1_09041 [Capronia coronata CBS 617.96]